MNDEQFESLMTSLATSLLDCAPRIVGDLRARDTAQREALARVEADRDTAARVLARQIDKSSAVIAERDTAQAQLAEAVGVLRKIAEWPDGGSQYGQENIKNAAKTFLACHAQGAHGDEKN